MSIEHIPADLVLTNKSGAAAKSFIRRGDTVSFMYEGERRTILVLKNDDNKHLEGVAKERQGDYRSYLWNKISDTKYMKPFVKAVPVTTVKFELEANKNTMVADKSVNLIFNNSNGDKLSIDVYPDGSSNAYLNGVAHPTHYVMFSDKPEKFAKLILDFTAE